MITLQDLQEAIAECEGQRNPSSNTCIKLAAFYTIRDHMFPSGKAESVNPIIKEVYSGSTEPKLNTEFIESVTGVDAEKFVNVMDELMDTLKVIHPRLYDSVISKLHP